MPRRVSSKVGSETPLPGAMGSFAQAASTRARIGIPARRLIVTSMPEPYPGVTLGRLGWFLESVSGAVAQPGQSRGLLTLVSRVRILPAPRRHTELAISADPCEVPLLSTALWMNSSHSDAGGTAGPSPTETSPYRSVSKGKATCRSSFGTSEDETRIF